MHLYLGLKSLLKVHVTSTGCYSECFHLDDSTFKLPLLAASQRSLCSHSQCLLHTYFSHSVPTFGREFLASIPALPCKRLSPIPGLRGKLLSLSPALYIYIYIYIYIWRTSLAQSWSAWQISFTCTCFSVPQRLCSYKIDQRQTHHKKHGLCQVLHESAKCLRGENIEDGCDQVHCNTGNFN